MMDFQKHRKLLKNYNLSLERIKIISRNRKRILNYFREEKLGIITRIRIKYLIISKSSTKLTKN